MAAEEHVLRMSMYFTHELVSLLEGYGHRPLLVSGGFDGEDPLAVHERFAAALDTLRADRLGVAHYRRSLTPFIDTLAARGTHFAECYVPCARTAPSLISLLTGTWPHTHGIRDNFVSDAEARLSVPAIPAILANHGYHTGAVSDWSGGDLGKFPLGFATLDLPSDQWNIKYLLRQGPKDLRLLLTLFTRNRFGKRFLPELYYLAGIPLTSRVGEDTRRLISRFANDQRPFLLNVFISTTHPPFRTTHSMPTRRTLVSRSSPWLD